MPKRVKKILALVITLSMLGAAMPIISAADDIANLMDTSSSSSDTTATQESTQATETTEIATVATSTEAATTEVVTTENNSESAVETEKNTDVSSEQEQAANAEKATVEVKANETDVVETLREAINSEAKDGENLISALGGITVSLLGLDNPVPMGSNNGAEIKAKLTS